MLGGKITKPSKIALEPTTQIVFRIVSLFSARAHGKPGLAGGGLLQGWSGPASQGRAGCPGPGGAGGGARRRTGPTGGWRVAGFPAQVCGWLGLAGAVGIRARTRPAVATRPASSHSGGTCQFPRQVLVFCASLWQTGACVGGGCFRPVGAGQPGTPGAGRGLLNELSREDVRHTWKIDSL